MKSDLAISLNQLKSGHLHILSTSRSWPYLSYFCKGQGNTGGCVSRELCIVGLE